MRSSPGRPRLAGALALALLGGACATLKPPTLSVDSLKVGDMGITGVALDIGFRVRNPNPEPIAVDKLEYELFLNGRRLGRGYEAKGFTLEGFGEGKVVSRFDVNLLNLPGALKDVLRADRGRTRVKGDFYVRRNGGLRKVGFDADAEVDFRR
jgi:LEA14-like dessication related protein